MRIEGSNSALTNLRNAPKVGARSSAGTANARKSLGETPPIQVPFELLSDELAELFAPGGKVSKLKRRLNKLKNKKCQVVPAHGTIACIDANDLVYLGVEFLHQFRDQEDVLAGVMAHEWGHSCALKPEESHIQQMNWDEIFELRRAHETLADELSGRLMALMGYAPDSLIEFLLCTGKGTHNLKYHDPATRADIIRNGHREELRKIELARDICPATVYNNNYNKRIIDDEV